MKAITLVSIIAMSLVFMSCENDNDVLDEETELQSEEVLNEVEYNNLQFMREEEKLARDVYFALYSKWDAIIFKNISNSEQLHMDALLVLINKYDLSDPVGTNEIGIFHDSELQDLYDDLVSLGSTSLLDAYKVGATIEDLDIFDLEEAITLSDNEDVNDIYEDLARGSRNHMRAFYAQIINLEGNYTAQFITQEKLDAIINSDRETGAN